MLGKFAREKRKMKLSGMSIFLRIREKYLKSNFDSSPNLKVSNVKIFTRENTCSEEELELFALQQL